jgi:tRNA A37 threonylcarbamoyltransferase TsaD
MKHEARTKSNRLFPEVLLERDSLDFSFSGLKSAVKREIDARIINYKLQITNAKKSDGDLVE